MTTTLKSSSHGSDRTLDIDRLDRNNVSLLTRSARTAKCIYVNGPALRDALLEAFPLEEPTPSGAADRLADWEKELLAADKPKPSVVPGMVFRSKAIKEFYYTILPDGKYVNIFGSVHESPLTMWSNSFDLVFDPRDAVALPSPLGIRVGDTVRRVKAGSDGVTITVEFEVHYIGPDGSISAKYGMAHSPKEFEVISREVPDRLPAGAITRNRTTGDLCLRLDKGSRMLTGYREGFEAEEGVLEADLSFGYHEVIYLP